ncbi:UDENN FLCN/SMCR8-type domain-containing protein [Lachancea thermotolerans]|uniref:KLTH0A03366p n=1 Tax=Lachancea thermotolerans (strain ATCC 56472 / CBS 6340 / NRRL Y-8284) TaxID=559295 RepID=C5DBK5_LACTC|nr:KLTH0A03366p [Lachancea thermotolerans CBS 6340]CAR21162.1 KLTH0A03366p [Lachancea thermotolerans CBS 6340]
MPNMLISLAHFCDKHGPRILLGTQFAKDGEELFLPDYPTDTYCDSCSIHFPGSDKSSRSMRSTLHSIDYVSTNYPSVRYQLISSVIRHIFSEETMTYDGSPLTFYDQSRGLNLVIGFKLQDNDARGDERRYGLILTIDSPDHASAMKLLSRHWEFVNYSFNKVIQYTKQQREDELRRRQISESYGEFTPMAGSYLRGNKLKIPRNLAYLTNDDLLFVRLHKWNTYMLDVLNMDE